MQISVDCKWSPWSESQCSTTCGTSSKTKTRTILVNASNGGRPCNGSSMIIEKCKVPICPGKIYCTNIYVNLENILTRY